MHILVKCRSDQLCCPIDFKHPEKMSMDGIDQIIAICSLLFTCIQLTSRRGWSCMYEEANNQWPIVTSILLFSHKLLKTEDKMQKIRQQIFPEIS